MLNVSISLCYIGAIFSLKESFGSIGRRQKRRRVGSFGRRIPEFCHKVPSKPSILCIYFKATTGRYFDAGKDHLFDTVVLVKRELNFLSDDERNG